MKFLKISDFADVVGVSTVTLRNWERQGLLLPHHKSPTGYRYYTEEQAEDLLNGRYQKENKSETKLKSEEIQCNS